MGIDAHQRHLRFRSRFNRRHDLGVLAFTLPNLLSPLLADKFVNLLHADIDCFSSRML